jgi:predicted glycosyltransferase
VGLYGWSPASFGPRPFAEHRYLLYSHDGLGLGHARRNLAVAEALTDLDPGASVLVATSADAAERLGVPARVDVLKLPGVRKVANGHYTARRLPVAAAEIASIRSAFLETAVRSFRPGVLLADKHPLGVRGELLDALTALDAAGGRAVLGLRDILDEPATVRREWARHGICATIESHYDYVLVYGDRSILDPVETYEIPESLAARVRFCGYVVGRSGTGVAPGPAPGRRERPRVLATAGGGEDGFRLLSAFAEAAAGQAWDAVVVAGPHASRASCDALRRSTEDAGVAFHQFVPGISEWLDQVDVLVCMGGYNTLAEAVSRGTPVVCVPRVAPRTEQLLRARAFARLGLLSLVEPERLGSGVLRAEVAAALRLSRRRLADRANAVLDFTGAARAARYLTELASEAGTTSRRLGATSERQTVLEA